MAIRGVDRALGLRLISAVRDRRVAAATIRHASSLPTLSADDSVIVESLDRSGVFVTSLEALGIAGHPAFLETAQRLARDRQPDARRRGAAGDVFLMVAAAEIACRPELMFWGLQPRLLDLAEAYLRLPVAYDGATLVHTMADGKELATRCWHRDREDRRMLKVAIYLSDVNDDGGPFEIVTRAHDPARTALVRDRWTARDDELPRLYAGDVRPDIRTCTGPIGTVVFADTARFYHRGRPATACDRSALFLSYFSRRPQKPWFCGRSGLSRREIVRLTSGLSDRQRASAMWWRDLSLPLRMLPTAPI